MSNNENNESQIASHWKEEELIYPSESFTKQANLSDKNVKKQFSIENFPDCFKEYSDLISWDKEWDNIFDSSNPPFYNWFVGGKLNASYNCVDRHLTEYGDKPALIWVPEEEDEPDQIITYNDLYQKVNEFSALLKDFCGLKRGDRVTLHMPMIPELPITMLACARIGVIHSQVFGGFSGSACGDRIIDSESKILITADAYCRNGKLLDHKVKADEAVAHADSNGTTVDKVLIWKRYQDKYSSSSKIIDGRDFFVDELIKSYKGQIIEPESMNSDDPLFLMYTSGTTAKPKGIQHSTGGYLSLIHI